MNTLLRISGVLGLCWALFVGPGQTSRPSDTATKPRQVLVRASWIDMGELKKEGIVARIPGPNIGIEMKANQKAPCSAAFTQGKLADPPTEHSFASNGSLRVVSLGKPSIVEFNYLYIDNQGKHMHAVGNIKLWDDRSQFAVRDKDSDAILILDFEPIKQP